MAPGYSESRSAVRRTKLFHVDLYCKSTRNYFQAVIMQFCQRPSHPGFRDCFLLHTFPRYSELCYDGTPLRSYLGTFCLPFRRPCHKYSIVWSDCTLIVLNMSFPRPKKIVPTYSESRCYTTEKFLTSVRNKFWSTIFVYGLVLGYVRGQLCLYCVSTELVSHFIQ